MNALKASWQVRAGLIPGTPMPEYDKQWLYSSTLYDQDGGTQESLSKDGSYFGVLNYAAHEYASRLRTGGFNWVTVEYLWL